MELTDQPVNVARLDTELRALSLPDYAGVQRLVKRRDGGQATASAPYLWVECGPLDAEQEAAVLSVLAKHDPTPDVTPERPNPRAEARNAIEKATTVAQLRTALLAFVDAPGKP